MGMVAFQAETPAPFDVDRFQLEGARGERNRRAYYLYDEPARDGTPWTADGENGEVPYSVRDDAAAAEVWKAEGKVPTVFSSGERQIILKWIIEGLPSANGANVNMAQAERNYKLFLADKIDDAGHSSRRRDCHFADALSPSLLKAPAKGRGGCSRMTVSRDGAGHSLTIPTSDDVIDHTVEVEPNYITCVKDVFPLHDIYELAYLRRQVSPLVSP